MGSALAWGYFLLGTAAVACAPPRPPPMDALGVTDPNMAASDKLPMPHVARIEPPAVPEPVPPSIPPRDPVSTAGCPMKWTPAPLRASVLYLAPEMAGRFMIPLYEAACACTRPGDHLSLVARIVPERGEITITTATRAEPMMRADPGVDACLAVAMRGRRFEAFQLGSDVVCPEQPRPKPRMGPPFFRAPRLAGCEEPATSLIVYPIVVDRRNEG